MNRSLWRAALRFLRRQVERLTASFRPRKRTFWNRRAPNPAPLLPVSPQLVDLEFRQATGYLLHLGLPAFWGSEPLAQSRSSNPVGGASNADFSVASPSFGLSTPTPVPEASANVSFGVSGTEAADSGSQLPDLLRDFEPDSSGAGLPGSRGGGGGGGGGGWRGRGRRKQRWEWGGWRRNVWIRGESWDFRAPRTLLPERECLSW